MGTPEFAVPSLKTLVEAGKNVVAVITAPDRPKGRGQQLAMSAVKEYAVSQNIPVLQPTNLKSAEFNEKLRSYHANLQVVVAFRMLPEIVWSMPEYGTFNLHASLLPQYRGAAPINWAIINGESETGLTTFFLKHAIDTGNIILQESEQIYSDDTAGTLYERLMNKGAQLVLNTVELIEKGEPEVSEQVMKGDLKHAPKIHKETCEIEWKKSCKEIYNFVRGLSPYPAAWTYINDKKFKIFRIAPEPKELADNTKGKSFVTDQKTFLAHRCGDGWASIEELQMEGKKRMNISDFLRGTNL
jgi:methionyl-tRNA formyltransferase